MELDVVAEGDCLEWLRSLPGESVQCCVTSPPYWGLRDYGVVAAKLNRSWIGCELSPEYADMARRRIERETALPLFDGA